MPGSYPRPVLTPAGVKIGVLFCNESLSPTLYRSLTKNGAEILVNTASHLWFNRSRIVFSQMKHANAVRAVENGRWLVQANNTVPALVLDEYGRVVAQTSWETPSDVLRIHVPRLESTTPYSTLGIWVLLFPIGALLFGVYLNFSKGPKGTQRLNTKMIDLVGQSLL